MTLDPQRITETDLMAFLDGELDAAGRAAVERYLADRPEKAAEIAASRQHNEAIAALFGGAGTEAVPARLDPHRIAADMRKARTPLWRMAAAAIVLLAIGSGAGWFARDLARPAGSGAEALIVAAVDAHELFVKQKRHPVEVPAGEAAHLTAWLSASLDRRLVMPDLSDAGYNLVGGRLLPFGNGSAAQIMYESDGDRITLYLTAKRPGDPKANRYETVDGIAALYWANDAVTCTIVGDVPRARMEQIASEVFGALNWQSDGYRRG